MGLNKRDAGDDTILARRERVAELRKRGATQRQIVAQLAAEGFCNPETKEPYSLGTVNSDLAALRKEWQADAKQTIAAHRAEVLAKLHEVYHAAWTGASNASVVAALVERTHDSDREVRAAAVAALGRVGQADLEAALRALDQEARLYGLPAPVKVAATTPDGKAVPISIITVVPPAPPAPAEGDGGPAL